MKIKAIDWTTSTSNKDRKWGHLVPFVKYGLIIQNIESKKRKTL